MKYCINQITPFDKIWYRDCIYHAILSGISAFGIDGSAFFCQNIYQCFMENDQIKIRMPYRKDMDETLNSVGVYRKKIYVSGSEKNQIIEELKSGHPVIIPVDKFDLPLNKDTYGKLHVKHYVLVYGIDTDENIFYIVENKYQNSYKFSEKVIQISELLNAQTGFFREFEKEEKIYYFSLEKGKTGVKSNRKQFQEEMYRHLKETESEKEKELCCISQFRKQVERVSWEKEQLESWITMCNDIIVNRKLQFFAIKELLGDSYEYDLNKYKKITKKWESIRLILSRCIFQMKIDESVGQVVKMLYEIESIERKN